MNKKPSRFSSRHLWCSWRRCVSPAHITTAGDTNRAASPPVCKVWPPIPDRPRWPTPAPSLTSSIKSTTSFSVCVCDFYQGSSRWGSCPSEEYAASWSCRIHACRPAHAQTSGWGNWGAQPHTGHLITPEQVSHLRHPLQNHTPP